MSRMRLGRGKDVAWFSGISRQFLGHGVQAMSRMLQGHILIFTYFYVVSGMVGTQAMSRMHHGHGNVREASGLLTGMQPDFQAFVVVSRTLCVGHVQDVAVMQSNFQAFLGYVQNAAGTHPDFHVFLRNVIDTMYRQCSACVGATAWMQPDFRASAGSFWDTVCRPRPGCGRDAAMFGMLPGHVRLHPCHGSNVSWAWLAHRDTETTSKYLKIRLRLGHGLNTVPKNCRKMPENQAAPLRGHDLTRIWHVHRVTETAQNAWERAWAPNMAWTPCFFCLVDNLLASLTWPGSVPNIACIPYPQTA
ncbi:Hypothetical predicted protein [Olea europaea subsp. europaea]|uniref:Uncharacterized protein n=1 Tax=Olea europaea subsp. europaea TaxID=158383 RepID=A0A8S0PTV0_OLEEU|nr:Hypothetical predicted protein [Olea europaea subsp. europaea]